eukprot:7936-Heterococcus_DN1.PRE.4
MSPASDAIRPGSIQIITDLKHCNKGCRCSHSSALDFADCITIVVACMTSSELHHHSFMAPTISAQRFANGSGCPKAVLRIDATYVRRSKSSEHSDKLSALRNELMDEMRHQFTDLKSDLRYHMTDLKTELRSEIRTQALDSKTDVRLQIGELKSDLKIDIRLSAQQQQDEFRRLVSSGYFEDDDDDDYEEEEEQEDPVANAQ